MIELHNNNLINGFYSSRKYLVARASTIESSDSQTQAENQPED